MPVVILSRQEEAKLAHAVSGSGVLARALRSADRAWVFWRRIRNLALTSVDVTAGLVD